MIKRNFHGEKCNYMEIYTKWYSTEIKYLLVYRHRNENDNNNSDAGGLKKRALQIHSKHKSFLTLCFISFWGIFEDLTARASGRIFPCIFYLGSLGFSYVILVFAFSALLFVKRDSNIHRECHHRSRFMIVGSKNASSRTLVWARGSTYFCKLHCKFKYISKFINLNVSSVRDCTNTEHSQV